MLLTLVGQLRHGSEDGNDLWILYNFCKRRIRFRGDEFLIAIVPRHLQIVGGTLGMSEWRVGARHEEIKQARVGDAALLHDGTVVALLLENQRIDLNRFLETGHGLWIFLLVEVSVTEVAIHGGHVGAKFQSLIVPIDRVSKMVLGVFDGANV